MDITGYTIKAVAKPGYVSFNAYEFHTTIIDPENGVFEISMDEIETANLPAGSLLYDVKVTSPAGVSTRVNQGKIAVQPAITDANPFNPSQGVRLTDPRVVHIHNNKDVLDNVGSAVVATDAYLVSNGQRIFVDSAALVNLVVPDTVQDGFSFEVFELSEPTLNIAIKTVGNTSIGTWNSSKRVLVVYLSGQGWKFYG